MTEIILLAIVAFFVVAETNMLIYFMGKVATRLEQERVKGTHGKARR